MKYQLFDIVMMRPEFGAKVYAIVEVDEHRPSNPYLGVRLDRGPFIRRYYLGEHDILARIGTLDAEALQLNLAQVESPPPANWQLGQQFASFMAQHATTELDRQRWALLAKLKPGDPIMLGRGTARSRRIEQHRFQEVLPRGQKYHFTAINPNGMIYRWTLGAICLGTGAQS